MEMVFLLATVEDVSVHYSNEANFSAKTTFFEHMG